MNFEIATATWLSEVALHDNPKSFTPETFPMPEDASTVLACVPEFIMGNVTDFTLFLQRFKDDMYEVSKLRILNVFLCRLQSIAAHRDHFVRRLSVCLSVR